MELLNNLPLTRMKILVAKGIYKVLTIANKNDIRRVSRGGINFELDLAEGIDLSIYLFGNFQKHILAKKYFAMPNDAIIFDVGANIGAMTLPYALSVKGKGKGKVFSFEPTDYAYKKLLRNISLNPELSETIEVTKCFVSSSATENSKLKAFSSWKLDDGGKNLHPVHLGSEMTTSSTPSITLDDFAKTKNLTKVNYIKIDTDGHEMDVLIGAKEILRRFKPIIVFECGQYLLKEQNLHVKDYVSFFQDLGYELINLSSNIKLNLNNIADEVPRNATIDIIAIPRLEKL